MRVLLVYPNIRGMNMLPPAIALFSALLKQHGHTVYEVDPLICPHCGGQMRFLAVIEEPPVIERILDQVGEWCPSPPPRAPPAEQEWPKGCACPGCR